MSRDATASVCARPARRQQPRRVAAVGRHAHPLDQDPIRVHAARPLLVRGCGGDRVAVGQAVVGERLGSGVQKVIVEIFTGLGQKNML